MISFPLTLYVPLQTSYSALLLEGAMCPDVLKTELQLKCSTHPLLCQTVLTIHTSGFFPPKAFCFFFKSLSEAE